MSFQGIALRLSIVVTLFSFSGCIALQSEPDPAVRFNDSTIQLSDLEPEAAISVEYGQPNKLVDATGNFFGIPRKLFLWDKKVDNHRISEETVDEVVNYLAYRNLPDTKVRVNQYAPMKEWNRLVSNKRISPVWKYTFGTIRHLNYTLFPGRLFGKDTYNPYTNTVHLYSDVPALGLAESAYAKEIAIRNHPGVYTVVQSLPFVSLPRESRATDEIIRYVAIKGDQKKIAETRRLLYARYGLVVADDLGSMLPDGSILIPVFGAGTGHLIANRENRKERQAFPASTGSNKKELQ